MLNNLNPGESVVNNNIPVFTLSLYPCTYGMTIISGVRTKNNNLEFVNLGTINNLIYCLRNESKKPQSNLAAVERLKSLKRKAVGLLIEEDKYWSSTENLSFAKIVKRISWIFHSIFYIRFDREKKLEKIEISLKKTELKLKINDIKKQYKFCTSKCKNIDHRKKEILEKIRKDTNELIELIKCPPDKLDILNFYDSKINEIRANLESYKKKYIVNG